MLLFFFFPPHDKTSFWYFFQVSRDLPEKQKEIEILLKDFIELNQQINQLTLWVTPVKNQLELYNQVGQPGAFDIKVSFLFEKGIWMFYGQNVSWSISCMACVKNIALIHKPTTVP